MASWVLFVLVSLTSWICQASIWCQKGREAANLCISSRVWSRNFCLQKHQNCEFEVMNIAILTDADQEHPEKILYSSVKQPFYATETCYFKGSSFRTTRINIDRINVNPNDYYNPAMDYYNPVIDHYNPVIDYYNPLLRFEPCLN